MYEVGLANTHEVPLLPDIERRACELFLTVPAMSDLPSHVTTCEKFAVAQGAGLLWVAREGGRPIGFALVEALGGALHLEEMDVLPEYGGKGAGRALLREVCRYAAARRQALTLTTFRDVPWNAPFYSRAGFRILEAHELSPAVAERLREEAARGIGGADLRVAMQFVTRGSDGECATDAAFMDLVSARRGHFRLESGHHGGLWLDLDALFAQPHRIAPFVDRLAGMLRPYEASAVCGPLLGGAFLAQLVAQALGVGFCFTERAGPSEPGGLYRARYTLPPALAERARGKRIAMVDDVMSAGSSLQATCTELESHDAVPVVAGALLVLGSTGTRLFAERGVPVEAVARREYDLWVPDQCPLCAAGAPLDDT